MLHILLTFLLFSLSTLSAATPNSYFSSQLSKAEPGDYIVTSQLGNYSVLIVRGKEKDTITLEEIDVPNFAINAKTIDWKTWVTAKAPGHSSWILLEIDLAAMKLSRVYSLTKRSFLHISPEEQFLFQLLSLPTKRLMQDERRKIGPPPLMEDEDHRPIWHPPIHVEGEKRKDPTSVYRAEWPHDKTLLSGCRVDLFFDDRLPSFPFPVWVEIYSTHFKTRLAVLDTGSHLSSPAPSMPHRPPQIVRMPQKEGDMFIVEIYSPQKFERFELYALDTSGPSKPGIRLLHTMDLIDENHIRLLIPITIFDDRLEPGHRYRLALIPSGYRECYTETSETFLMNP
ncbi:MAG: hypothetical protein KGZ39_04175 [Simkania sp.]|nr:hypothetical protein [Simkania sp.]